VSEDLFSPLAPPPGEERDEAGALEQPEPLHPRPPTPEALKPSSRRSNLTLRLITAALVVPPVIYVIVHGGLVFLGTVIAIILLGLREFYQLIEAKGAHPLVGFGLAAGVALPVVAFVGNEYHATILMTVALLGLMVAQLGKAQISEALASISGTFFGIFYVGWLLTHAVTLRFFRDVVEAKWGTTAAAGIHPDAGIYYMLFAVGTVVWCDAAAYFAGRAWGKRKLAPKISPGKTVEGALGGIAGGVAWALILRGIFDFFWPDLSANLSWTLTALLGALLAAAGIAGDLVESLLKRDAQSKDTGTLLPGMGGVLDRIDSTLLAIPVMYYFLLGTTFLRVG
jgi:phosphatidate cytidylyltransferase